MFLVEFIKKIQNVTIYLKKKLQIEIFLKEILLKYNFINENLDLEGIIMLKAKEIVEKLNRNCLISDEILNNKYVFTELVKDMMVVGYLKEVPDNDVFFEKGFEDTLKENNLILLDENKNKIDYIDMSNIDTTNSVEKERQVIRDIKELDLIPLEQNFSLKDLANLGISKNINEVSNKVVAFLKVANFNELNMDFKKQFNRDLTNNDKSWLIDKLKLNDVVTKFNNLLNGENYYIDLEIFDKDLTKNLLDGMTNEEYRALAEEIIDPLDKIMPTFYSFNKEDIDLMRQRFNEMCKEVTNQFNGGKLLKQVVELELDKVNPQEYNCDEYLKICQKSIKRNGYFIKYVNFESLPVENNKEFYAQLCQIAIDSNNYALEVIKFENLPEENNREIYTKLCQKAVEWGSMEILKFVKYDNLLEKNREQIYFDLCKEAITTDPWALEYVNTDYISKSDYFKLCDKNNYDNDELFYSYNYSGDGSSPLSCVKIENLISQDYLTLCKQAIEDNIDNVKFIEPKYFPTEQATEIYTQMCQEYVSELCYNMDEDDLEMLKGILSSIRTQYLPEEMQNLEGENLKNALLNYNPSIDKGLGM